MEKHKAEWCRQFVQVVLASGKWKDVASVVWLADKTYESAGMLLPAEAVRLLGDVSAQIPPPPKRLKS